MQASRASAATALTAVLSLLALALFGALSAAAMDTRQHASASPSSIAPIAAAKPPHPSPHHAIRSVRLVPSTQGTEPPSRTHRTEDCHNHYLPHHWCVVSALSDLFTATHGASWSNSTNWLSGDPCANGWSGITCTNGLVTALYASSRAPAAHAPQPLIASLRAARQLNNNNLVGTIPTTIAQLTDLQALYVREPEMRPCCCSCRCHPHHPHHHHHHHHHPRSACSLLYSNAISGSIPSTISQLTNLVQLYEHTIHTPSISCPRARALTRAPQSTVGSSLYDDYLSGTIPSTIGSLVNLQYLYGQCVQLSLLSFLRTDVVELHDGAQSHVQQQPGRLGALDHRAALAADLPVPHLPSPLCCGACTDTG